MKNTLFCPQIFSPERWKLHFFLLGLWNFKMFQARTFPDPFPRPPPSEKGNQQLLVDTVGYSIQTCWLLRLLMKPLTVYESKVFSSKGKSQELHWITIFVWCCCGWEEEPAILIFRLLLRIHCIYVVSIHLDFQECMECTKHTLIMHV